MRRASISLRLNGPCSRPNQSYHATNVQGATVKLDFVGTGVRVFSTTVLPPGSYEVYVDGKRLPESVDSTPDSDAQLLLGSITGIDMGPHTVTLVNLGVTGDVLDFDRVQVESALSTGRYGTPPLPRSTAHLTDALVHYLPQLSTTPLTRFSGDLGGFLSRDDLLSITAPSSACILRRLSASPV